MSKVTTRSIEHSPFRVEFIQSGDRIAHIIFVREPADANASNAGEPTWVELLRSIESDPDVAWPESPPLQELHIEDRGGVPVALLVGRAGKSHWSASIGVEDHGNDAERLTHASKLVIDIACRVTVIPQMLGSAYELGSHIRYMGRARGEITDLTCWQSIALFTAGDINWQLDVAASDSIRAIGAADHFRIVPELEIQVPPATVRWRSELSFAG